MDPALRVALEMNQRAWSVLMDALDDLSEEEARWRPSPHSDSINVIVRRLRIALRATTGSEDFVGFHQAMHIKTHCARIRAIRAMYRTTRGERC